jgi:hypothetical protein
VECIPEHILFSVRTRCLEWKTCNLTSISPNAAASTVYNTKSYKEISAKIKIKKKNYSRYNTHNLLEPRGTYHMLGSW